MFCKGSTRLTNQVNLILMPVYGFTWGDSSEDNSTLHSLYLSELLGKALVYFLLQFLSLLHDHFMLHLKRAICMTQEVPFSITIAGPHSGYGGRSECRNPTTFLFFRTVSDFIYNVYLHDRNTSLLHSFRCMTLATQSGHLLYFF